MSSDLIDPRGVGSRAELAEYLSQSLLDEYYERVDGKVTRQLSTSLKTYVLELHRPSADVVKIPESVFETVERTEEPTLWRAFDSSGACYFLDAMDDRFVLLHTIEKTKTSDQTVRKLTTQTHGADRCWFPSYMLERFDLGRMIGFRLGHQPELMGLDESAEALELARDLGRERPPAFRLHLSEYAHAGEDLAEIRESTRFGRSAALTMAAWRSSEDGDGFLHNEVWSNGKMTAYGTSFSAHLGNAVFLRHRYAASVRQLERNFRIAWEENGTLGGEPLEIRLRDSPITNVRQFAEDLVAGAGEFNIWGVVDPQSDRHVAIEAVDLHTKDRFSLDVYPDAVILYLKRSTCGNVFLRFLTNLERHVSAQVSTNVDSVLAGDAQ